MSGLWAHKIGSRVAKATLRRISRYVEDKLSDGSVDPWHLETLVPVAWIDAYDVDPGEWIAGDWLPYTDFDELGVTGDVMARVEGMFASPVITDGPGRVVLSTIEHLGEDLYELTLHSADGTTDALGVTAPHRFYSEERGWVAAAELEEGEVLRGHDGPLVMTQIGRIEGTRPVYNFSVEADHVYYAGSVEALTHNSYGFKISPAWIDTAKKGVHMTVDDIRGVELMVRPTHNGEITFVSRFASSSRSAVDEATRIATDMFDRDVGRIRSKLLSNAERSLEWLRTNPEFWGTNG